MGEDQGSTYRRRRIERQRAEAERLANDPDDRAEMRAIQEALASTEPATQGHRL
jgi:hypothetical protein